MEQKIVPREPTDAMEQAGFTAYRRYPEGASIAEMAKEIYRAMYDAAPSVAPAPDQRVCELGPDDAEFGMSEHCRAPAASAAPDVAAAIAALEDYADEPSERDGWVPIWPKTLREAAGHLRRLSPVPLTACPYACQYCGEAVIHLRDASASGALPKQEITVRALPAKEDGRAGWLAQLVIDKLGGTNDLEAWVHRSAKYYADEQARADTAELKHKEDAAQIVSLIHERDAALRTAAERGERIAELEDALTELCACNAIVKHGGAGKVRGGRWNAAWERAIAALAPAAQDGAK